MTVSNTKYSDLPESFICFSGTRYLRFAIASIHSQIGATAQLREIDVRHVLSDYRYDFVAEAM
jgi:hypothetical protein